MKNVAEIKFGQIVLLTIEFIEQEDKTHDQVAMIPGIEKIDMTHVGAGVRGKVISLHYHLHGQHMYAQFIHMPGTRWRFESGNVLSCSPDGKIMMSSKELVGGNVTEGNLALDGFLEFLQLGGRQGYV